MITEEILQTVAAFVVGGLVIPLVGKIKQTVIVNYVRPEFLTGLLAIGATYGLSVFLAPDLQINDIIRLAMAAIGGTSLIYGGKKAVVLKKG